ncbi:serine hydrolase [Candidatus Poribacteria bacterium]|nr:serine hydrolase [Candidatus Poribacteria bacterium]
MVARTASTCLAAIVTMATSRSLSAAPTYTPPEARNPMQRWLVLGPIRVAPGDGTPSDTAQRDAFARDQLADSGGEAAADPTPEAAACIGDAELAWTLHDAPNAIVDLTQVVGEHDYSIAYAYAAIDVPSDAQVVLGVGSDDSIRVWLNGELVHDHWVLRAVKADDDVVPIRLRAGTNRLLLKVQNATQGWGFACRILDTDAMGDRLVAAARVGRQDTVDLLLAHGADASVVRDGLSAAQAARIGGFEDLSERLTALGSAPPEEMPSLDALVSARFDRAAKPDAPGIAVLIARDGKTVVQKTYGLANLSDKIPVTPKTKFRIGSITKQFTAAAILKLQEEGKLSVADPLSQYIPDYTRGDEISLRHLLTHTSGVPDITAFPEYIEHLASPVELSATVNMIKRRELSFDPGTMWAYSNSGYLLLQHVIESVSGKGYADYLRATFFDPLGMVDTGVHDATTVLDHEAIGYSYGPSKITKSFDWDMSRAGGAGALYSTVEDLYKWNEAVFTGKVLAAETLREAFTPVKLNDGSVADALGGGYGYGWMFDTVRGMRRVFHSGGLDGFLSALHRYPDAKTTIVVLANAMAPMPDLVPSALATELASLVLWREMSTQASLARDVDADVSRFGEYVGSYELPSTPIVEVAFEDGKLYAGVAGQPRSELLPSGPDRFFSTDASTPIRFERDETGAVARLVIVQGATEIVAKRVETSAVVAVEPSVLDEYVGEYDYGRGAVLTVTREGDHLMAQMTGQPKFEIFPRGEDTFFWKVAAAEVTFVRDESGVVVKALHRQGPARIEAAKLK